METIIANVDTHQLDKTELRESKILRKEFKNVKRNPIYIILDSLKVAHNIGTILRLADATLVEKVFICGKTIVPPNKKIKDSARGAEKWVPWEYRENVLEVITELKEKNISIISLEIANNSIEYTEAKYQLPACFVFGREYDGVNKKVLEMSDEIIHLPIFGMANSINVSTTASVILYDTIRKIKEVS
ncbi:MAG: hypothetical protein KA146_07965 [Leptospiraceae bacterium]|nr:hypothetical protein [Leptospiraceae bacterium]